MATKSSIAMTSSCSRIPPSNSFSRTQYMSLEGLEEQVIDLARKARSASERVAELSTREKNAWLMRCAERLEDAKAKILAANAVDLERAAGSGISGPMLKRLELAEGKWRDMIAGLRDVAALPDPVGKVESTVVRPNGLQVGRMRIPLGVIGIIYESRPNVTVDAAALCVKAGNAVILRGGLRGDRSESSAGRRAACGSGRNRRTRRCSRGNPRDGPRGDRHDARPRSIHRPHHPARRTRVDSHKVTEKSRIPVVSHDAGVCHIFVDASADPGMATRVAVDSKISQMEVCNGLETLLVHRDAATTAMRAHPQIPARAGCRASAAAQRRVRSSAMPFPRATVTGRRNTWRRSSRCASSMTSMPRSNTFDAMDRITRK